MANEKCGACGSPKTSILGKDKRIGKTCGNEDCKLHLTVINLAPKGEEGKGEPLPKTVGGPKTGLRSIEQAAREYVEAARDRIRARSRPISYEVDAATEEAEDAAWTNLCVAVDGWKPGAQGSAGKSPALEGAVLTGKAVARMRHAVESWDEFYRRDDLRPGSSWSLSCHEIAEEQYRLLIAEAAQGSEARSARESSSGPSPESSPAAAPQGVEARPMKGGADAPA